MIKFIGIPTEQTTAITDLILSVLAMFIFFAVNKAGRLKNPTKTRIWMWAFGMIAFAAFMGFLAHGFEMSERVNFILWQPLNLALGLAVAFFVIAVMYDLNGNKLQGWVSAVVITLGVFFYFITIIFPGSFVVFVIYETLAMLIALVIYLLLALWKKFPGAWLMSTGILLSIIAGGIQASQAIHVRIFWEFDHNGVFHIVQMVALVVMFTGLRMAFAAIPLHSRQP